MAAEPTRPMLVTAASPAPAGPRHPPPDPEIMAALSKDHRQRRIRQVTLVGLVAVAVAVIAVFAIRGARAPRVDYVTSVVSRGTLLMPVSASGSVEPKNAVDVGADISGRVDKVFVEANDRVEKGALLARLQTDVLDLAVKQARAAVVTAQANRQQAEIAASDARLAVARADALRKSGAMTEVDHQQVESVQRKSLAALAVIDANIAAARAGHEMARANRDKAEIRAPISGIVLRRSVEPGQVVVSALQAAVLFRLAEDLTHLEVRADIDEADVGRVEAGQEATFTVSAAPEQTYRARVRSVSNAPRVMQQVVTYEAILDVENADGTLRPGMTASVKIQTGVIDNALLVPSVALRFAPNGEKAREKAAAGPPKTTVEKAAPKGTRVWILDGQTPVAREVVIVGSDGERTAVTGLEEGAAVILSEKARS